LLLINDGGVDNMFFSQFLSTMLQGNPSTLAELTSLACHPFLCIKDPAELPTYLSTPLFQFFLPCPPMQRERQDPLRPRQAVPLLMMFCPLTSIMLFTTALYLAKFRFRHFCFVRLLANVTVDPRRSALTLYLVLLH